VPTEALARVLNPMLPAGRPAIVIPDPSLSWDCHQMLKRWSVELQTAARLPVHRGEASGVRTAFAALYQRLGSRSASVAASPATAASPAAAARKRKKVIWFGKHGTRHTVGGMCSLSEVVPALEAINRKQPIELVIVSNSRRKFDKHFSRLPFATRYRGWSNEAVYEELQDAAAFVMPNGSDGFSACKSANRALLALANGVPVVASWLDSLAPLKDVIVLDDWAGGLERYLLQPEARENDIARAAEVIEAGFSPSSQGRAWLSLLRDMALSRQAAE
jgi:glycosyltransferase involved in cell wall biosynthesis